MHLGMLGDITNNKRCVGRGRIKYQKIPKESKLNEQKREDQEVSEGSSECAIFPPTYSISFMFPSRGRWVED